MCPAIVPRWEWRTFGEGFGAAEERLATGVTEDLVRAEMRANHVRHDALELAGRTPPLAA